MTPILEVIVQSVEDARAAAMGGANQLEVVRAIRDGGLTPAISLVRAIAAEVALPLRVMMRENAGFTLGPGELPVLRRAVEELTGIQARLKPDTTGVGIVVGFAADGELRLDDVVRVLEGAPALRATFHRAFDTLRDPLAAIDVLAQIPRIDRILTSGGSGSARQRSDRLAACVARAGDRLTIVAGGGVDEEALTTFARTGCVRELHVGRAARENGEPDGRVSIARVRRLRAILDS